MKKGQTDFKKKNFKRVNKGVLLFHFVMQQQSKKGDQKPIIQQAKTRNKNRDSSIVEQQKRNKRIIEKRRAQQSPLSSTDMNSYRIVVVSMCVECGAAGWSRLCFPIVQPDKNFIKLYKDRKNYKIYSIRIGRMFQSFVF